MSAKPLPLTRVATVAQRLAVLLASGVSPRSVWSYLELDVDPDAVPESLARFGERTRDDLEGDAWRGLAAAWMIATAAGAPLAPALRDYAASLRALVAAQRASRVALSGPVATARLVMALPIVGVLFGVALGFDTLATLFTTVPGGACLLAGVALLVLAHRWNRRLVAAARPREATPGLECDLLAIAVGGGASFERALRTVTTAADRWGLMLRMERLDEVLALSTRAGVPAAELLRSEAAESRSEAAALAHERAAALSVTLMIPLGVCVLPAFMLLGVAPLVISVVSATIAGF